MIVTLRGVMSWVELEPLLGQSTVKSRRDACTKLHATKRKSRASMLQSAIKTHVARQQHGLRTRDTVHRLI